MARVLAVVLSAALYGLSFPPFGLVGLAWVALVPLLWALRGASLPAALGLGYAWGALATLLVIAWVVPTLQGHFQAPLGWSLAFWLGLGATTAAPYAAIALAGFVVAARRVSLALRPVLFVAAWVSFEYARSELLLRSPWASLAQVQAGTPWVLQVAALTGAYGVSALLAWTNAVVAELLGQLRDTSARREAGARLAPLCLPLLLVLGALLVSERPARPEGGLRVALVQGNVEPELRWRRSAAGRVLRRYVGLTRDLLREASQAQPDLIVWPENAVQTSVDDPTYGPPLRALARHGVPLLLGAPRSERWNAERLHFNSAFLLRPDGTHEHYDKRRLLPFSETRPLGRWAGIDTPGDADASEYTAGARPGLFDVAGERVGVLICVEALDARLARELAAAGATLLVNLSNESWFGGRGGAEQHLQQAALRAVETGLPVVRATTTGVTAVIAPDGRVVASLPADRSAVLDARVPAPRSGGTFYRRHGDLFAALCIAVWLGALAPSVRSELQRGAVSRSPRAAA